MGYVATSGFLGPLVVTGGFGAAALPPPEPPPEGLPLQSVLPAYLYKQYSDDKDLQAFIRAENAYAQGYLDWVNATPLGLYTSPNISGPLLDWIMAGLYGLTRPVFASTQTRFIAGTAANPTALVPTAGRRFLQSGTATLATDDFFKRVGTWWLYAGVTRHFSIGWLRARIARFLYGVNGGDVTLSQTQTVRILTGMLPAPPPPMLTYAPGGTFAARTYAARNAYVSVVGEGLAGQVSTIVVPPNNLLVVVSPPGENGAVSYNTYADVVSTNPGHFRAGTASAPTAGIPTAGTNHLATAPPTRQNLTALPIGSNWGEPSTGLISGANLPTVDESNRARNFIISVPASDAATLFKQAFEQNLLAFPITLSGTVVIS